MVGAFDDYDTSAWYRGSQFFCITKLIVLCRDDERAVGHGWQGPWLLIGTAQRHADKRDAVRTATLLEPAQGHHRAERVRRDADAQSRGQGPPSADGGDRREGGGVPDAGADAPPPPPPPGPPTTPRPAPAQLESHPAEAPVAARA